MKQKDIFVLVGVGILAAIISAVIAGAIFSSSKTKGAKAPEVSAINGTLPDVHNDSQYNTIFNDKAIDPTQLIKVGPSQNQQPFSNANQ